MHFCGHAVCIFNPGLTLYGTLRGGPECVCILFRIRLKRINLIALLLIIVHLQMTIPLLEHKCLVFMVRKYMLKQKGLVQLCRNVGHPWELAVDTQLGQSACCNLKFQVVVWSTDEISSIITFNFLHLLQIKFYKNWFWVKQVTISFGTKSAPYHSCDMLNYLDQMF